MSDLAKLLRENSGGIILLLCVFACVLYCFVCKRWGSHRAERQQLQPSSLTWLASAAGTGLPRDIGLSKMVIDALPTYAYDEGCKEDGETTACSICLSDVKKGEMMRVLPYCKHGFHTECIDMWLHSHSLCPLCRAKAKPPAPVAGKTDFCRDPTDV